MAVEGKSRGCRSLLLTARALFAGAVFDILAFIALLTTALFMSFKVCPLLPLPSSHLQAPNKLALASPSRLNTVRRTPKLLGPPLKR
jgi:hypothetical protein